MRADQTAIFCDLDGTLFDCKGEVSIRNKEAISRYVRQGGLFAIATGRCPDNMIQYLDGVDYNAPCILLNGAGVYDFAQNSYLYTKFVNQEAVSKVLRRARKLYPAADLQIYTEESIFYVSPKETVYLPFWELHQKSRFITIEEAETRSWFKALFFGTRSEIDELQNWIAEQGLNHVFDWVIGTTDIVPGSRYLEMLPKNTNKGSALKECRNLSAYRGRKLIGVGDYFNDLELLEEADIAACPCNSHPDVIAISDWILSSNNDSAIADLIGKIENA